MTDTLTAPTEPEVADSPAPRPRRWWGIVPAVLVPTALVAWHASLYGRWLVDDAGITFAYARSVATGAGPVLQPGLPAVEGFSNPAWLALLVVGRWLGLFDHGTWFGVPDYVAYPKALAIVLVAGMFGCFYATASAICRRPALVTIAAGAICAAIPSFVIWCVSGLENSLFALAVVALATVLVRAEARERLVAAGPAVACGLLAALAALTRPEGLIYAAAYPLAVLVLIRRGGWLRGAIAAVIAVAAFAIPVGAYLLWRYSTFGAWLPTTAVAKSQGLPTAAGFAKVSDLVAYAGWLAALAGVLVVGAALARTSWVRHAVVLIGVPLALALAAFGVLVNDWMIQYRFATPVWALGALVVAVSAAEVLGRLRLRARVVVAVVAVAAAVLSGTQWVKATRSYQAEPVAPMCLIVQNTGREFNGYVGILGLRDPTLFAPEIGGGALVGTALLTDGAGLAEPVVAKLWAAKDWAGVRDYVFDVVKPSFIRSHGQFRPQMAFDADPRFQAAYILIGPTPNKGGNWVRRDLVPDAATMARLQAWAAEADAADAALRATPLASCGDRLVPGATTA
jgi:hypothetical protein